VTGPFEEPDEAATALTSEERRDLIPSHVAFRSELNAAEQDNIARGRAWAFSQRRRDILSEKFICDLHRRMLGDVWKWAGKFRLSERNIGIDHWRIPTELRILIDDARMWIDRATYPSDEISVRFHHRLVAIHPFPNGNGRHARLMADLLITRLGGAYFSWGSGSVVTPGDLRHRYISALRAADAHDIGPLLAFARS
jgi:Fic-DOC domain mobile mystery protein B